jgi:glutathione S-transferase
MFRLSIDIRIGNNMSLLLYYAPFTCAMVPYIGLTEAGADFRVEAINLRTGVHKLAEFTRINPKQKVPALRIDGEVLTENVAIQVWIARNFPAARLLPVGGLNEYRALSLIAWCASAIHPALTPNFAPQRYCDVPGTEDAVRRCSHKLLREHFTVADTLLAGRDFFFDHFTFPDAYFFWCFRRAQQFKVDISAFSSCVAHFERMSQRPGIQKLLAFEQSILAEQARS